MKLRILSLVAVAILLAACAKKPTETAATAVSAPPPAVAAPAPPRGPAPDSLEYFNTVVGNMVNFAYDKYDLDAAAQTKLKGQAAWLKQYPSRTLTVEGHCDERGTREYNLGLGDRRANSVKQFLIGEGVAANRIKTISYGKERPICVSSDEACWAKNRRGTSVVQ
jgi:peptidoglycan-associated lipoprotein